MDKLKQNLWSAGYLAKVVAVGALLGVVSGLLSAGLEIPENGSILVAAGTTGVVAATLLGRSKPKA